MANCKMCTEFDTCPFRYDPNAQCSEFKQKPMSNGDRIRSMTDEELARFMGNVDYDPWQRCDQCKWESCEECCLDWLKKEAEE